MKIIGLLALLVIFSLCISESPITTTPPKTTQEPTETPTYTPPTTTSHATTPSPTTPTPTTPVDNERNICEERQLPENLIQFVKGLDYDNNANDNEIYVADTAKDFIEKGITPEITEELFNLSYKKGGKEDLEDLVQNIDSSIFKKIIEDNSIENHEKRLIEKSFTYSGLQNQLKILNDKASENFLKTYKTVIYKSESGRTESEKFLYNKIDEHLPEFEIGEDGFLYYGKEKLFKVDDKNLYVKWLDKPYDPDYWKSEEIWKKRDCYWEAGFDKEFSLCWSKFIGESTDIPWITKYYSVKPIEDKFKDTSNEARVKLKFDKFGYNGLGYDQIFDIYIYRLHMNEPRTRLFIEIPKNKEQLYNHYIGLYDKGTHINDDDFEDPNIIFSYEILYKENEDILDRSFAELYYATEFFWDYLGDLARLIGSFEE